jgi:hypothetical protein
MSGEDAAGSWTAVVFAVLRRPTLWPTALRQALRLVPRRWWAERSHLPLPDPDYLRFRTLTAAGGAGRGAPDADEVVAWLRWSRSWPAVSRSARVGGEGSR